MQTADYSHSRALKLTISGGPSSRRETAKPDSIGEWSEFGEIRICEKIVPFGDVGDRI